MTLDEAIKHCEEVAAECDLYEVEIEYKCGQEHRQFAEWLKELKEAKRLLKLAVENIHYILDTTDGYCTTRLRCDMCPASEKDCLKWRYADEAEKLIGERI